MKTTKKQIINNIVIEQLTNYSKDLEIKIKKLEKQNKIFEDMLDDYRDIIKFNCKNGYLFVQGIEEKYNK